MPDQEILNKLEGLVIFKNLRIGKLVGEGKENVVLHATKLDDKKELVLKLYQSNPMFLLNEVDFDFLPESKMEGEAEKRHLNILEKLLAACERENPGLFFWHLESLYSRIVVGLCNDFEKYDAPVIDTTTSCFQNSELIAVATKALNRKATGNFMDVDWEYNLKDQTLRNVISFISKQGFGKPLNLQEPTALLAVVFCEGFFGDIPSQSDTEVSSSRLFGGLTDDFPSPVEAEAVLAHFLDFTDFKSTVLSMKESLPALNKVLEQLRTMLMEDAFDKAQQLKAMGDRFVMKYNAGRNTLLRGLPRFIRIVGSHQR